MPARAHGREGKQTESFSIYREGTSHSPDTFSSQHFADKCRSGDEDKCPIYIPVMRKDAISGCSSGEDGGREQKTKILNEEEGLQMVI